MKNGKKGMAQIHRFIIIGIIASVLLAQNSVAQVQQIGGYNISFMLCNGASAYQEIGNLNVSTCISTQPIGTIVIGNTNVTFGIFYQWANITKVNTTIDITQSLDNGNLTSDWTGASSNIYGIYNLTWTNEDFTLGKDSVYLDNAIDSDWTANDSSYTLNFAASEAKTYSINASSRRPFVISSAISHQSLTYTKRWDFTMVYNQTTNEAHSHNLLIPIPKTNLTEWSSRTSADDKYCIDSLSCSGSNPSGLSYAENSSHVNYIISNTYGSSSLAKGLYNVSLTYYIQLSPVTPRGGGGGGDTVIVVNESFTVSPRTIDPMRGDIPAISTISSSEQVKYKIKNNLNRNIIVKINVSGFDYVLESGRTTNGKDMILVEPNNEFTLESGDIKEIIITASPPSDATDKYYAEVNVISEGKMQVIGIYVRATKFVVSGSLFDNFANFLNSNFYSYKNEVTGAELEVRYWHIVGAISLFTMYGEQLRRGRKKKSTTGVTP